MDANDAHNAKNAEGLSGDVNETPTDAKILSTMRGMDVTKKLKPTVSRPKLREIEICNENGIQALENMFRGCEYDIKINPYKNLTSMMSKIEYWAHLLHPSLNFHDFISRVEALGEKRMVQTNMNRLRFDEYKTSYDDNPEEKESEIKKSMNEEGPLNLGDKKQQLMNRAACESETDTRNCYEDLCDVQLRNSPKAMEVDTIVNHEAEADVEYLDDTEALDFIFSTN